MSRVILVSKKKPFFRFSSNKQISHCFVPPHRFCSAHSGFTLIEVLAAIVLFTIVLPAAMMGISSALSAADYSRRSIEAAALGEAKLNELIVSGEWQSGLLSGDFMPDSSNYTWKAQTVTQDLNITELDLQVSWISRGQERSIILSTYVFLGATASSGSTSGSTSGTSGGQ
jgi:prepilin-type N-terminal cleavage/methylation domain-containing protein